MTENGLDKKGLSKMDMAQVLIMKTTPMVE